MRCHACLSVNWFLSLMMGLIVVPTSGLAQDVDDETFLAQMTYNKLPPPASLGQFSGQIKRMRELGASNAQIAEYMSKVIDRRLEATNKPQGESLYNPGKHGVLADRQRRWQPLDDFMHDNDGKPGKPIDNGRKYQTIAQLAWDNRVGNCGESANVAYAAMQQAGVPVRIFNSSSGNGHEFAVIGLAANADPNNPATWGPDARVVDGWIGSSLSPDQAKGNPHIFGGRTTSATGKPLVSDQTGAYDDPKKQRTYEELGEKGRLAIEVKDEKGRPVGGVKVVLHADEAQEAVTSGQGLANFTCYPGKAAVSAVPAKGSGFEPGDGEAYVETKRIVLLVIKLKAATETPVNITAPADGTEVSAEEITVTGETEGPNAQEVLVMVNGQRTFAAVDGNNFTAHVKLADGKNVLVAVSGTAGSVPITVTRVAKLVSKWEGRWQGKCTVTMDDNGRRSTHTDSAVFEIVQIGDELELRSFSTNGKPSPTSQRLHLDTPIVASHTIQVGPRSERVYRAPGYSIRYLFTLRDGKLYHDSKYKSEYDLQEKENEAWVHHVTNTEIHGTFDRAP